ncbi:MAG: GNAT family N-acetyltransferase [Acidimicrobiia bacterium]
MRPIQFRAIDPGELDAMADTMSLAFGFEPSDDATERLRQVLPLERTRCGFDGDVMVGTSGTFELDMSVPGGSVPCAGTTMVAVAPTHRRQGVLRRMMRSHLDDVLDHGESIAALWASDSAIYGRFGYGLASVNHDIEVKRANVVFHRNAPEPAPVRIIDLEQAATMLPPFFEGLRVDIPGFFHRDETWWKQRRFSDPEHNRDGMTSQRLGVVEGGDGVEGYVQFRVKSKWDDGHGAGRLTVRELLGTTPESWAGLWSFVLNHDLIEVITADNRPTWEPLFDLLEGARRAKATQSDALWVRLMDIPAALTSRSYSASIDVVFEVTDPMGDVSGTYRLHGDEEGADCGPTSDPATIRLDLEDLGACYMGRSRFEQLARSGRVSGTPEALRAADRAFTWEPQPWCQEIF